jgi:hypothetical protein
MLERGTVRKLNRFGVELDMSVVDQPGPRKRKYHVHTEVGIEDPVDLLFARDAVGAEVGDLVEVLIPDKRRVTAGLVTFGVPAVFAIAGAVVGSEFGSDAATGIGMAIGLVVGLGVALLLDRVLGRRTELQPRVTRVLHRATARPGR